MVVAATLAPALTLAGGSSHRPPQLGGTWQLNVKESETLQQKMEQMRGSGPGGGFGGGDRGGGGGMGGGPPMGGMPGRGRGAGGPEGGGPDGGQPGAGRDPSRNPEMRELARPPMTLLIEQADSTLVLSERGLTLQVLVLGDMVTAGAAIERDAPHVPAKWHGERLVAERLTPRGGRFTQEFELSRDGRKLIVRTRREGRPGRPPLELKRVYDRYEGE